MAPECTKSTTSVRSEEDTQTLGSASVHSAEKLEDDTRKLVSDRTSSWSSIHLMRLSTSSYSPHAAQLMSPCEPSPWLSLAVIVCSTCLVRRKTRSSSTSPQRVANQLSPWLRCGLFLRSGISFFCCAMAPGKTAVAVDNSRRRQKAVDFLDIDTCDFVPSYLLLWGGWLLVAGFVVETTRDSMVFAFVVCAASGSTNFGSIYCSRLGCFAFKMQQI